MSGDGKEIFEGRHGLVGWRRSYQRESQQRPAKVYVSETDSRAITLRTINRRLLRLTRKVVNRAE